MKGPIESFGEYIPSWHAEDVSELEVLRSIKIPSSVFGAIIVDNAVLSRTCKIVAPL